PPGLDRQRVVAQTDIDRYITAPADGIAEPLVPLGSFVLAGTPLVRLHDFDSIDEPGLVIPADQDGYVIVRRFRSETRHGDVVAGRQVAGRQVYLDLVGRPEGAAEDVAVRVAEGLVGGEASEADLVGNPGVIAAELVGFGVLDKVGSTVPNVGQIEAAAGDE